MSSIVSPRPSCRSVEFSTTACPPLELTATSNETRVRVDGFSKISATDLPPRWFANAAGSAFTAAASRSRSASSSGVRSSTLR